MSEGGPPSLPEHNQTQHWTPSTWRGVIGLLTIHALLLGWLAAVHSPTYDEPGHLAAGYRIWDTGHVDLYVVNPPLVKFVAACPLLLFDPQVHWDAVVEKPGIRQEFGFGRLLIEQNPNWYWMLLCARLACIPFSLIGAWVAFRWSRELFGPIAGWIALTLWTFDPNLLGNGSLITPDVGASSMGLLAAYLYWKWNQRLTWVRAASAGLGLGLALLCKSTMLILGPIWIGVWLVRRLWTGIAPFDCLREIGQLALLLSLGGYVLNGAYGFSGTGTPLKEYRFVTHALGGPDASQFAPGNRFARSGLGELPIPLPRQFVI